MNQITTKMEKVKIEPTNFREAYIAFKVSGREKEKISQFCQRNSLTISDFVRKAIKLVDSSLIEG